MPGRNDSILNTTKKLLGIAADDTNFDIDVIMHVNSVFATLQQLGVGPTDEFMIEDAEPTWGDFIGSTKYINSVVSYIFLKVRLLFDPPAPSALTSFEGQIREYEYRLLVAAERDSLALLGPTAFVWELEAEDTFPPEAESGDLGIYRPTGNVWRKH